MAISAIDYTDTNPLSRIQFSELNSVYAVKDWIRKGLRGMKGISKFNRPSISINPKTMIRRYNNSIIALMYVVDTGKFTTALALKLIILQCW